MKAGFKNKLRKAATQNSLNAHAGKGKIHKY